MIQHYVEFVYPGILFGETSAYPVEAKDPDAVQIPANAVGFRFFTRVEATIDGETVKGEKKEYSGWYYLGRELTLDDVKRTMPNERILISNMECNHWDRVVSLRNGQVYNLNSEDRVIQR